MTSTFYLFNRSMTQNMDLMLQESQSLMNIVNTSTASVRRVGIFSELLHMRCTGLRILSSPDFADRPMSR